MSDSARKVSVVGGGPAGLAAAIACACAGFEVTVIDCAAPPIDKACGEGLLPDSAAALGVLGIALPSDIGFPFRGIRFQNEHSAVAAEFPRGSARGVRRVVLHRLLSERAANLGVSLFWRAKNVRLAPRGVCFNDRFLEAGAVIAADGQNSTIRRQAHLDRVLRQTRRYGFRRHYFLAPWSPYMEFYWSRSSQIYVTPVAANEVCVAVLSRDPQLRLDRALTEFPQIHKRLLSAPPASAERGGISLSRSFRRISRPATSLHPRVILVGDASGSVDAITGEGICLAIEQALALAQALRAGDLRSYSRSHRRLMYRPRKMASLLLLLAHHPWLQRRALAALARRPEVFQSLLAVHVGASSFLDLCSWRLMDFGRAFLTA